MASNGYFSDVANTLLNGMGSNMFDKAGNLISAIAPIFSIGFGIYVLLIIINAYNRGFDENVVDLTKRMMGWLIIIACAFNGAQFGKIANIAWELPDSLSSLYGSGHFSTSALDAGFDNLLGTVGKIWKQADKYNMEVARPLITYVLGLVVLVLGCVFFLIVGAFYLVTKLSLAMTILVGPLFIGCMLFPATRQYAMNWIGQIFNYAITITFYIILMDLQLKFFNNNMSVVDGLTSDAEGLAVLILIVCMFIISTFIFVIVAWNIPSIANALTGGASVGGFAQFGRNIMSSSRAAGALGGSAARGAKGLMSRMKGSGGSVSKG